MGTSAPGIFIEIVSPSGHPPTLSDRRCFDIGLNTAIIPPCEALVVGLDVGSEAAKELRNLEVRETVERSDLHRGNYCLNYLLINLLTDLPSYLLTYLLACLLACLLTC